MVLTPSRIKAKLRSGEMAVSGDQWPRGSVANFRLSGVYI